VKNKHDFDTVHGAQGMFRILLEALTNPGRVLNFRRYAAQFAGQGRWLAPAITMLDKETGFFWDGDEETGEEIRFLTGAPRLPPDKADFVFLSRGEGGAPPCGRAKVPTYPLCGALPRNAPHHCAGQFPWSFGARRLMTEPFSSHSEPHSSPQQRPRTRRVRPETPERAAGSPVTPPQPPDAAREEARRFLALVKQGTHIDPHTSALLFIAAGTGQKPEEPVFLTGPGIPPEGRRLDLYPAEAAWCRARDERGFEYPCGVELVFLREDDSILAFTRKTAFLWAGQS
jgi:alpha-D-ribose 1-methylphosphonate 5-triphosphate synthase subunit PhnH